MCPALPISQIGSDAWNAMAYQTVAAAYSLANLVRTTTQAYILSRKLWNLDKQLKFIQEEFYKPRITPLPMPSKEQIAAGVQAIKTLHASFENLAVRMKAAGLYNQSRLSAPLVLAMARVEDLAEFAYIVEVSLSADETAAIDSLFDQALEELRLGETISAESIF